ncbi:cellulase family glycosylhydrolase [Frankia sp. Cppng1_Ct_nod]|uniref:glycoside hydrolase 5 family protein n=1 Tax=Frankia sp. Cppng1_Ct_nod TaxID=2897162 RepID=UPI0010416915|nr:cellulase family glycosylhydrolase [Frankia sp. Cppng1_Ct_nod]
MATDSGRPGVPADAGPSVGNVPRGFVTVRGSDFALHGRRFRFGGTNNYYLHYKGRYMADCVLHDAAAIGLRVIRCWGFLDGTPADGVVLQPEPFTYDEDGFEYLDYTVFKAGQLGLRLVIVLTNNWGDFGGIPQYANWFSAEHDDFFRRRDIKDCYKAWVKHVINRRNRYTGVRYDSEPTVMTWELANEPRCPSDRSGNTLVTWVDEMSRHVKRLAPRQLVAVGDEGFYGRSGDTQYPYSDNEGVAWNRLISLPTIDYGTFHLYQQHWGEENPAWGTRWIRDHIRDAHAANKPAVLEEFGWQADAATRDKVYAAWTDAVERFDGDGDHFWILTSRNEDGTHYADYDGLRVVHPSSTALLLAAHAGRMSPPNVR